MRRMKPRMRPRRIERKTFIQQIRIKRQLILAHEPDQFSEQRSQPVLKRRILKRPHLLGQVDRHQLTLAELNERQKRDVLRVAISLSSGNELDRNSIQIL